VLTLDLLQAGLRVEQGWRTSERLCGIALSHIKSLGVKCLSVRRTTAMRSVERPCLQHQSGRICLVLDISRERAHVSEAFRR